MRTIFAGIVMLSASTVVVHAAQTQRHAQIQPGYGYMQAPVGHRQPLRDDAKKIARDNAQLDLPAGQHNITGANQVQAEENTLATTIAHENERLDRLLKDICRGC